MLILKPSIAAAFHESDLGHDIVKQVESTRNTKANVQAGTDYIGSDVCGNGGCKTLAEYCAAIKRNGKNDARCN